MPIRESASGVKLSETWYQRNIDAFIEAYNENAKAFVWTKSQVYQKRLKARFADQ